MLAVRGGAELSPKLFSPSLSGGESIWKNPGVPWPSMRSLAAELGYAQKFDRQFLLVDSAPGRTYPSGRASHERFNGNGPQKNNPC
ncbi:hypothetical protein [Sphingobacterium sp.]|uniref:hypothetical protein n=1 Tax=Sphingobacterium sp. TaxID=341027 RepID=UPI0028AAEFEA|nr:hypothetical protein [Sphingobacterium sp.]